jgi:two-component system nitrogen regulation sensor histidine kinase NtrY
MNAEPGPDGLVEATPVPESTAVAPKARPRLLSRRRSGRPPVSRLRRVADLLLGKGVTLVLAALAIALVVPTFVVLAGALPRSNQVFALVLADLVVLLLLGAVLAGRLTRVWVERRRGSAGSRLHVRLVLLFSVVAITPAIVVAVFSTMVFNLGIQAWFNEPVRTALQEGLQASRGYLEEHRNNIRADALGMANDLTRAGFLLSNDPDAFGQILAAQTGLRGLTEAVIFDPDTSQVLASAGLMAGMGADPPPPWAVALARSGDVAVLGAEDSTSVRAVVQLNSTPVLMLEIGRPVDPGILDHMKRTEVAVATYDRLDKSRSGLQVAFALVFALVALLVLAAAVLIGLVIANQIARPVGRLITAAERVRGGDLGVRVPEASTGDELAGLSRAFNRMTGQLGAQRTELMDAYSQLDERRRFTEAVLSGVSAGVIGLDPKGCIELPNRAASELLGRDLMAAIGRRLDDIVPEFAPLLQAARDADRSERPRTAELQIGPASARRTLLVRIGADRHLYGEDRPTLHADLAAEQLEGPDEGALDDLDAFDGVEDPPADEQRPNAARSFGFVATFDDITELQSAQRKAAWSDVARRIAHEIKNPLTPIQLAAERLKRRFTKEITSDPDTFALCADTIVRHVGDIGRMVDEFSAFARMPQPVIKPEDIGRIAREALVLQRTGRPEIEWVTDIPERGPIAACDRRLIGQALTNLLQNAADAVGMREAGKAGARIAVAVRRVADEIVISVADDGVGLPAQDRGRLTEPYVTHKPKGTGLGLAIVKKILEDHGGRVLLEDRAPRPDWPGTGAVAMLILKQKAADVGGEPSAVEPSSAEQRGAADGA